MPRQPRLVIPGFAHHVTQRGNYRQSIFENENDFRKYCYWMAEYSQKYDVKILAYCLMSNHVHFIVIPLTSQGLAQVFKIVHMRYGYYKNHARLKTGHLWQGRFYSNVLEDGYLLRAIRYVERNPYRAGMVKKPGEYVWASTREHVGLEREPIIKTCDFHKILSLLGERSWEEYLEKDDPVMTAEFREKSLNGAVIGNEDFIADLEQKTGYCLRSNKMGRPEKVEKVGTDTTFRIIRK